MPTIDANPHALLVPINPKVCARLVVRLLNQSDALLSAITPRFVQYKASSRVRTAERPPKSPKTAK